MESGKNRKNPAIWVSVIPLFVALSCLCSGYVLLAWAMLAVSAYLIFVSATK